MHIQPSAMLTGASRASSAPQGFVPAIFSSGPAASSLDVFTASLPFQKDHPEFSPKNSVWKRYFADLTEADVMISCSDSAAQMEIVGFPTASHEQSSGPVRRPSGLHTESQGPPSTPPSLAATIAQAFAAQRGHMHTEHQKEDEGAEHDAHLALIPSVTALHSTSESRLFSESVASEVLASSRSTGSLRDAVDRFGAPSIQEASTTRAMERVGQRRLPTQTMQVLPSALPSESVGGPPTRSSGSRAPGTATSLLTVQQQVRNSGAANVSPKISRLVTAPATAGRPLAPLGTQLDPVAIEEAAMHVIEAASSVTMKTLHELRSFRQPPVPVCEVVEAAIVLLGFADTSWLAMRRHLDGTFLQRLHSFDAVTCPQARIERFFKLLLAPAFGDAAQLSEKCPAAFPLANWCLAMSQLFLSLENLITGSVAQTQEHVSLPDAVEQNAALLRPDESHLACSAGSLPPAAGEEQPSGSSRGSGSTRPFVDLDGLIVTPPLWELTEEQLAHVENLVVAREGIGSVTFHGMTDCRGLLAQLPRLVVVQRGEVAVYPDPSTKPPVGHGLNKPASIILLGCMPKSISRLTDIRARERYRQRVAKMTEEKGAIFEDYDCQEGTWRFRVTHF